MRPSTPPLTATAADTRENGGGLNLFGNQMFRQNVNRLVAENKMEPDVSIRGAV